MDCGSHDAMAVNFQPQQHRVWQRLAADLLLGAAVVAGVSAGSISRAEPSLRDQPSKVTSRSAGTSAPADRDPSPATLLMAAAPGAAPPSTQSNTNKKQETFASKLLVPGGILLLAAGGAYGLLLWRRPRSLLVIPDDGISLSFTGVPALKEVKLGAPLARWLKYRPRVLDAWIEARSDRIRARFEALATVEQRRVFIPLPVRLGDKLLKELTPETYRETLSTRRLTLITAEGGAGKTSLAIAIGRWGMEKKVVDHPVVPVLIEADLNEGETPLSRINRILVDLTDDGAGGAAGEPLSEAMVKALLARRRLLLIVDHYSELSDESRSLLNPTRDNFPVGWVIVTSRREENFQGLPMTVVTPQRLESNRLQAFFHDYLREKKRQEAEQEEFWDDDMLQRAQERLRRITEGIVDEKREITVLLAKLYIDTVIAERREGGGLLPDSVPQLMRTYVDQINRTIEEGNRLDGALVRRSLQWLAMESLGRQFRPHAVARERVLVVLDQAIAEMDQSAEPIRNDTLFAYLRDRLRLVESPIGAGLPTDRLQLDPLADYLAAMWWLQELGGRADDPDASWNGFLDRLPRPGSEGLSLMRGFLRALLDCCEQDGESGGFAVPPAALERLSECAGIDREQRDREREARRIRRLIDDLSEPEQDVRLAAIEQLLKRGSAARAAVDTLARVLTNPGQELEVRSSAAVALGGIGGGEAAMVLLQMAGDGEQPVALRRAAAEALGLCQVPAERNAEIYQRSGEPPAG